MKPRITINITVGGEFGIRINEAGRDLLVKELQNLSEGSDHFHFHPEGLGEEVPVQGIAYRASDHVLEWGKVSFRPDSWDEKYFPHVLHTATAPSE